MIGLKTSPPTSSNNIANKIVSPKLFMSFNILFFKTYFYGEITAHKWAEIFQYSIRLLILQERINIYASIILQYFFHCPLKRVSIDQLEQGK